MKNEIWLDFCVWDFEDVSHEEISRILDLEPTKICVKGTKKRPFLKSPVWGSNGWRFQASKDVFVSFEEQMEQMLDIIESRKKAFEVVCNKYYCELSLALYIYVGSSTPSVHFDKRYLKVMEGLNVEFDIDIILLE